MNEIYEVFSSVMDDAFSHYHFFVFIFSLLVIAKALSFVHKLIVPSNPVSDRRRDKALEEFRELSSSGETDPYVWNDFWERNEEFSEDIMRMR